MKRPKTAAERKARVAEILVRLDRMYPGATCALVHHDPWELLVATILSAQCTDKRVNEVTPGLFAKYPTPRDFAAVRPEVLANDIRSTGFFNNKAKSIVGAAQRVVNDFGGQVPKTMEEMLSIPGAARKTANVVLGTAYGIASGIVVDTHVSANFTAPRLDEEYRPGEDRAGPRQDHSQRTLDPFFPPDDSARARPLHGARSLMRPVRSELPVLRPGQAGIACRSVGLHTLFSDFQLRLLIFPIPDIQICCIIHPAVPYGRV